MTQLISRGPGGNPRRGAGLVRLVRADWVRGQLQPESGPLLGLHGVWTRPPTPRARAGGRARSLGGPDLHRRDGRALPSVSVHAGQVHLRHRRIDFAVPAGAETSVPPPNLRTLPSPVAPHISGSIQLPDPKHPVRYGNQQKTAEQEPREGTTRRASCPRPVRCGEGRSSRGLDSFWRRPADYQALPRKGAGGQLAGGGRPCQCPDQSSGRALQGPADRCLRDVTSEDPRAHGRPQVTSELCRAAEYGGEDGGAQDPGSPVR